MVKIRDKEREEFEKEERYRRQRWKAVVLQLLLAVILALVGIYGLAVYSQIEQLSSQEQWARPTRTLAEYEQGGVKVLAEQDQTSAITDNNSLDQVYASENFRLRQVTIGGEILTELEQSDRTTPLEINDVKNELFMTKAAKDIKMLISWRTNKTASGFVEYAKEGESAMKKIDLDGNGFSHTVLMPTLDASSVYTYVITCQDRWGVEKKSDKYVFYTGAPNVSLMDVLENAAKKVFGWAM